MMIDVDSFKVVNDTYGHLVGDHVLAGIGAALRTQSRSFDLVGRLGGDEFAVLMPDTDPRRPPPWPSASDWRRRPAWRCR